MVQGLPDQSIMGGGLRDNSRGAVCVGEVGPDV